LDAPCFSRNAALKKAVPKECQTSMVVTGHAKELRASVQIVRIGAISLAYPS
jgi:hypothetical protein